MWSYSRTDSPYPPESTWSVGSVPGAGGWAGSRGWVEVSRRDPTANERGTVCRQRLMTKRIVAANHLCEPPNSPRARAF